MILRFSDWSKQKDQTVKLGIVRGNNSNKGNCGKDSDPGLEEGAHNDDSPYENTEKCWAGKKAGEQEKKGKWGEMHDFVLWWRQRQFLWGWRRDW